MLINNINKFNEQKQKEQQSSGYQVDQRFQNWKVGYTYQFRILGTEAPAGSVRVGLALTYQTHIGTTITGKKKKVICPRTFDRRGYESCPVCQHTYKITKLDKTACKQKEVKDLFPKWAGILPVIVTVDLVNPDNVGHVKLIHLTKGLYKYFNTEGIINDVDFMRQYEKDNTKKTPEQIEYEKKRQVGFNAINLANGRDLIIKVDKNGEYNEYIPSFDSEYTAISVPVEQIKKEFTELKFDEYVKPESAEKLEEFYELCVKKVGAVSKATPPPFPTPTAPATTAPATTLADQSNEIPGLGNKPTTPVVSTTPTPSATPAVVPTSENVTDVSMDEIDDILNS